MNRIAWGSACLLLAALLLGGCETVKSTWRSTKELYKEYVNTNPQVDLGADPGVDTEQQKLAGLLAPMDEHLESLKRYMEGQDTLPPKKWFEELFHQYPWISGMAVVNTEGVAAIKFPEVSLKPLNFKPLLDMMEDKADRGLRAYGDATPLGPEIFLAVPFYKDNEWKGLTIVHFDPRGLVKFCPDPNELVLLTGAEVLWHGKNDDKAAALSQLPWDELLQNRVSGTVEAGGVEFLWLCRYIGTVPLVYATPVD